jgi:hypothetical protein
VGRGTRGLDVFRLSRGIRVPQVLLHTGVSNKKLSWKTMPICWLSTVSRKFRAPHGVNVILSLRRIRDSDADHGKRILRRSSSG